MSDDNNSPNNESLAKLLSSEIKGAKFPNNATVVTGSLTEYQIAKAAEIGIEHIINFQPVEELEFDEQAVVLKHGMSYSHVPIIDAKDLKQLKLLELDKILRMYQGKKTLMHCKTGNRVGACMALRAGWLRGRKIETALEQGREHGMTTLEQEVYTRLLVPL